MLLLLHLLLLLQLLLLFIVLLLLLLVLLLLLLLLLLLFLLLLQQLLMLLLQQALFCCFCCPLEETNKRISAGAPGSLSRREERQNAARLFGCLCSTSSSEAPLLQLLNNPRGIQRRYLSSLLLLLHLQLLLQQALQVVREQTQQLMPPSKMKGLRLC